ncbi:MAG: hypothetical protein ABIJ18_05615 [archaeon]
MNKKGKAAIEASILVFLILLTIVGYIVLAPQETRDELLGEDSSTSTTNTVSSTDSLLSVSPGEIKPSKSDKMINRLDPVRIYTKVESETQTLANSLSIARSLIHNDYKNIYFDIEAVEELDSLELIFLIVESKGAIKVEINGNEIYEGTLTSNNLPLEIPTTYLHQKDNIIKLSSTSPGWKIFSSNYYLLQEVRLFHNYLLEETEKTRTFSIDDIDNLKRATLSYYVTCNSNEEGRLTIYLNGKEEFSDDLFCEYLDKRTLVLDDDQLETVNNLRFVIDNGDYNIDEIEIESLLDAKDYPTYSFEVDTDDYDDISSGDKEVILELAFGDSSSRKEATIFVQEHSFKIDTYDTDYSKDITSYIDNGANSIKIQPSNTFEVDNLKVVLN